MVVRTEGTANQSYDVLDGCYGVIQNCCRRGAFLVLDNGELAFAYNFGNLWPGTAVNDTLIVDHSDTEKVYH